MTVHDCYGVLAPDTEISAKLLREAFCEIYSKPVLENWTEDVLALIDKNKYELPELPDFGSLDIQGIKESKYFFN
jgi:DNA-directed RNA polymerase